MGSNGFLLRVMTVTCALGAVVVAQSGRSHKPENFSPLGYYDLRAYEQAFPAAPGDLRVLQAEASRYWVYQGVAYRGLTPIGSAWTSVGPLTTIQNPDSGSTVTVSGRVATLAISPDCLLTGPCRLWVGTAGGGVWRTDDAMNPTDPQWRWVSAGLGTNSIGSLTLDPNDRTNATIFVGTGETNQPNNSAAGTGLYRSTDGGDTWSRIPTMIVDPAISPVAMDFTFTRGISTVVVEPGNSQTIYVATASAMLGMTAVRGGQTQTTGFPQPRVGLYKTVNGGVSWALVWVPPVDPVVPPNPNIGAGVGDTMFGVRQVKLDPKDPHIVYATAWNNAIHRSAPALEGGDATFKPVFAIVAPQRFRDLAMFDLTTKDGHTRIYAYNGTDSLNDQALYRLDNADVPASALVTSSGGALANTGAWQKLSSNNLGSPGSTSRSICSTQCFYDLLVATPAGQPDTVIIGGVQSPDFGEPTMRSTDAGVTFAGFGNDAQNARNSSHVDVRAIAFHPANAGIAFVGSDGGVVRNDGVFVSNTRLCVPQFFNPVPPQCAAALGSVPQQLFFLNRGLQTMQFYNVSLDPHDPLRRMMGGLQDNSTIWLDGMTTGGVWKEVFPFGDGTSASGFHPARSDVLFASFQSTNYFTNFRNGVLASWVRTGDPINASAERSTITQSTGRQFLTFDRARPDTQFTGFQHVWRTQSNGGGQAFLELNCRFQQPVAGAFCGDWVPLGVAYPFANGSTPDSTSRKPGDLTSEFYGNDRVGGLIVAAERSPADGGTLWAATNFGRLFISKNADAPGNQVAFARLDDSSTPMRFVTRIVADPANSNAAFVSYSGFNALTPSTPGHVFRVVYDPGVQRASFTLSDFDLGDLPINTIAFDDARGDLYAATDFGPLVLPNGATSWQPAGLGFPEAVMVDLKIAPGQRVIVAATHGMGIFYMTLPPPASKPLEHAERDDQPRLATGAHRVEILNGRAAERGLASGGRVVAELDRRIRE
jgi:hypothetical protein